MMLVLMVAGVAALAAQSDGPSASERLYDAIRAGDTSQVTLLLSSGADVNAKDRRGEATPLMHAAAFGSIETMRTLLDRGADVKARNTNGATALMWAATDLAKIKLLLARGAEINAVSTSGRSVLLLAAMSDSSAEIVRFLLSQGSDPRATDKDAKISTLKAATLGNDTETIRQLVAAGVDVNAADARGETPLMDAAGNGNLAAVQLLLAKGANVKAISGPPSGRVKNGVIQLGHFTALQLASTYGPLPVIKALLEAGADVNERDARGMTALMLSVSSDHGDVEIAKALIAAGADVNAKSLAGETALAWAEKSAATSRIEVLKRAGAATAAMEDHEVPGPMPTERRAAVDRSLALMERSTRSFFTNAACGSCHAQNVTDFATAAARSHGFRIDETSASQRTAGASAAFASTANALLERFDPPAVDILLYTLGGFAAGGMRPDRATDAMVANAAAQQLRDGRWSIGGIARPPIGDGDFSRTALGIRGLTVYGPPGRAKEMADRIQRAVRWLVTAAPVTTEDRSFRVLGLAWGGADQLTLRRAGDDLAASQRNDGGWAQRTEMASDAYATGLALVALRQAGMRPADDPSMRKGASYLLSRQRADGSWYVRSRAPKFQPYFEGGFPYGHDQWISSMATGWATTALAMIE
jgi:ankyrin repeat protein